MADDDWKNKGKGKSGFKQRAHESQDTKSNRSQQKEEDALNALDYQKSVEEQAVKLPLHERAIILGKSFKLYFHIVMAIIIYIPIMMTFAVYMLNHEGFILAGMNLELVANIQMKYTQIIFFAWIPELLTMFGENPDIYFETIVDYLIQPFFNYTPGYEEMYLMSSAYMWLHQIVSMGFIWMVALALNRKFLAKPKTLGEKWESIFDKQYARSNQSQTDKTGRIQEATKKLRDLKPFLAEVKAGVGGSKKYVNTFVHFLPVYRFFFNIQDSIRANMLAGRLNARWEEMKKKKQEIQNEEKFLDLIDSGYGYGDTPRDDIKRDIVNNIKYRFETSKGSIFHAKKEIFAKGNIPNLKRNMLILLSTTVILKNQILPPLFRFLEKKYGIKYNRSEKSFISNARKIYTEYDKTKEYFSEYHQYDMLISLQYDYPFYGEKEYDLSLYVSKNINEFNKMQQAIIGYMNEINSLLPKAQNFHEPQPAFVAIFVKNIYLINVTIANYIAQRLRYDPAVRNTLKKTPEKVKAKCLAVSRDLITGSFVKRMALQEDPPLIKIYADGEYVNGDTDAIKINIKNNNLVLGVMNLSSYGALKNGISTMGLGQINYVMDQVYTELDIDRSMQSTLDGVMGRHNIYESFDSIIAFLELKEEELKGLE